MCRLLAVCVVLGLTLAGSRLSSVSAYGVCEPGSYCPPWRAECARYDCLDRRGCDYRDACYYGPANPPPRHQWRAEQRWAPEKHDWRDYEEANLPLPMRRPATPADENEAATANSPDPARDDELKSADATSDEPAAEPAELTRRQQAVADGKMPDLYRDVENPVGHTLTAIQQGASLYREHCIACHGAAGEGDGPRAQAVNPPMPSLPYTLSQDYSSDAYLLWTIMDGGEPVGTEKPGFDTELTREQAWKIIAYMRAGFPARSPETPLQQMKQTQMRNTSARTR